MRTLYVTLAVVLTTGMILCAGAAVAGDWTHWRGPNHNGGTEATGLPAEWSTDDGVLWEVSLPGPSSATPVISGNRVFIVSNDARQEKVSAMCLDRDTGKELWSRAF